ncbi:hypothetical protein BD408DRAFT_423658 [Parasitella parasitica]|nr:hypothetical protein BD408DRAFT_423658 [Parasitella parasitica]
MSREPRIVSISSSSFTCVDCHFKCLLQVPKSCDLLFRGRSINVAILVLFFSLGITIALLNALILANINIT